MPSTYSRLTYHIVFSTKHREPLITLELCERLYQYFGGIVQAEGGVLMEIGSVADHVHLLMGLKPTHAISDLIRVIKANSSRWINEEQLATTRFAWQEECHAKFSFLDELQTLCERHGVEFDAEHFGLN